MANQAIRNTSRMRWFGAAALAICGLGASSALASGDFGPSVFYTLIQSDIDNNVPFLAPANDSRANLLLLLADAGLARPHPLAPSDPATKPNPYAAETPLVLDTFTSVFDDHPKTPDAASDTASDASGFTDGQGDRCRSNAAGSAGYLAALAASGAPAAEQAVLTRARQALGAGCGSGPKAAAAVPATAIRSAQGKDFAAYLAAAADFYAADLSSARKGFAGLADSRQPWIKEAARYMTARVDVNAAQMNAFGDYGELTLKNVDGGALTHAKAEFQAYLHDYPRGVYATSARGLLRRVAWLGGDDSELASAFGTAFDATDPSLRNVSAIDLAYEADAKLLAGAKPADVHEPRLLAALDLMQMRRTDGQTATLTRAELETQRPAFAGQKALYDYLLAAYAFYDEGNADAALKILDRTAPGPRMSWLQFSAQMLKGLALEAEHKPAPARAQWLALIPVAEPVLQRPAVELALAQNYERGGDLASVFAPDSPIHDATYRELLLTNSAGPDLLRQRARAADAPEHEREVALYDLLLKELTRSRYQAFLDDLRLMPASLPAKDSADNPPALADFNWAGEEASDGFACPSIRAIATALAHDPHAERSLICLGEFMRVNSYDGVLRQDNPPAKPGTPAMPLQLSSVATQFPGIGISRLDVYKTIINDPRAEPDLHAYALFRAINCWAPSGSNACDSSDAPKSQRKQWFEQLKTRYRDTVWASSLKYYW